jgi:hypothetical protein
MQFVTERLIQMLCRHARWTLPISDVRWCVFCGKSGRYFRRIA